ncbi:MAG: FadR family transcriptional regulator [Polyangiaceae bacterium]|nr:FadR family transcriptional regulator [Polyangiaceae bacterium]
MPPRRSAEPTRPKAARGQGQLALVAAERPGRTARGLDGELTPSRKADQVARDLLRKVTSREIAPGDILPKEEALATQYGVNRGVVREAIKLLEVHRLVRPVRRRGTVVLEPLHSMSPEVLVAMLLPRPGHVDLSTLGAFLEVRGTLDVEMTALAAERRTAADLKAMRAAIDRLGALLDDGPAYSREVQKLPLLVARATRNPMYEMLAAFNARVVSELEASLVATRPASREQREGLSILVDVIERRDVEGARRAVATFHAWSRPRILASAALASGAPLSSILKEVE